MKAYMSEDELYPVYSLTTVHKEMENWKVEIPEGLYQEYKDSMKTFKEVQAKLKDIHWRQI